MKGRLATFCAQKFILPNDYSEAAHPKPAVFIEKDDAPPFERLRQGSEMGCCRGTVHATPDRGEPHVIGPGDCWPVDAAWVRCSASALSGLA